jgi:hypothetical protein
MENRVSALTTAGSHGLRAAWMALDGQDPELLATPRAYPRGRAEPPSGAAPDADSASLAGRQAL